MAFLDNFNNWYVRAIPDDTPGKSLVWQEPPVGARIRWKRDRGARLIFLAVILAVGFIWPSKHGDPSVERRLVLASAVTALYALVMWIRSNGSERILVNAEWVVVGVGRRGAKRIRLENTHAVTMREIDGHPVLSVWETADRVECIYVDPSLASQVRELPADAGRLKSTS